MNSIYVTAEHMDWGGGICILMENIFVVSPTDESANKKAKTGKTNVQRQAIEEIKIDRYR